MTESRSGTDRKWIVGCVVLAAALRLFRIGHQSLWIDEMISLGMATDDPAFWSGLLRDIHGPLTSAMLHLWMRVDGSETWLRLLYWIPSVATVPLMYRLGTDLFDRRAGRLAVLAAAISPFLVWYAQEIRNYSWAFLWATAALILFVRVWDGRGSLRTWVGLTTLLSLGILTNFSFAFLLPALTVAVLARRPFEARFVRNWAGVLLGAGLVFLPWFLDWFHRIGGERLFIEGPAPMGVPLREASGFAPADIGFVFWTFAYGYSLGPTLRSLHLDRSSAALLAYWPVLVPGALAVAVGAVAGLRRAFEMRRGWLLLTLFVIPLALAIFLAVREVKTFHPRYLTVTLPVILTLLAAGWSAGGRIVRGSAVVAGVLALVSLSNHYFDPAYGKEDSRGAARLVLQEEQPGDSVVVIYSFRPFRHYFSDTADGKARLCHLHKRFLRNDDEMRAHVADAREGAPRVWLVLSRWWDVAPESDIRRVFEESLHEVRRWDYEGVKVTLYEGRVT